jgi:hypothetical protein
MNKNWKEIVASRVMVRFNYADRCINCGSSQKYLTHDAHYVYFDCTGTLTGIRDGKRFEEPCKTRAIVPITKQNGELTSGLTIE